VISWFLLHISQQENIIREFNLNELYQKSKKLSKTKGAAADKAALSQFPPVLEEEEPEQEVVGAQEEDLETKKDK
jgi:hypothetical protein